MIDLHSHLVPGFDDGVTDADHALAALRALRGEGVRTVVTTPHFSGSLTRRPDTFRRVMDALDRQWEVLLEVAEEVPELEVRRAVELRLDIPDPDLSDPRLRLAGSSAVLVEFDGFSVPLKAEDVIRRLAGEGWTLLLAHPERYRGASVHRLRAIREAGCHFQVNAGSLTGRYGGTVRELAWSILEDGLVAVIASDYHGHREPDLAEARIAVDQRLGGDAGRMLFEANGRRLLDDDVPGPVPVRERNRGLLERVGRWLGR